MTMTLMAGPTALDRLETAGNHWQLWLEVPLAAQPVEAQQAEAQQALPQARPWCCN